MYIAQKPCTISGNKYLIDDVINTEYVSDEDIARLVKMKLIVATGAEAAPVVNAAPEEILAKPMPVTVPIITDDGVTEIALTAEGIYNALKAIQSKADEAVEIVKVAETEAECILIHKLDERKTVKAAAEARAEELTKEPNPDDDPEGKNPDDDPEGSDA